MTTIETTANRMLIEHVASGDSYRTLGARYGISHESCRKLVIEEGTKLINALSRDLLLAEAAEYQGLNPLWPRIAVGFGQTPEDWRSAILMFAFCCERLRRRGFDLAVTTDPWPGGTAFVMRVRPSRPPRRSASP